MQDSDFGGGTSDPGVEHVRDDAVGAARRDEFLDFVAEEGHAGIEFGGSFEVFGGEEVFEAWREADFGGREGDEVEGYAVGVMDEGGVGRGGNDGDVVAAGGEEADDLGEGD